MANQSALSEVVTGNSSQDGAEIFKKPLMYISQLTFSDGQEIDLGRNDIVVFVGPNNSGKSLALREINSLISVPQFKGKVITALKHKREGSADDLVGWLEDISGIKERRPGAAPVYEGFGYSVRRDVAIDRWNTHDSGMESLTKVFCNIIGAEQRLTAANSPQSIRFTMDPLGHPIHHMYRYSESEIRISRLFRKAFGSDLIVHRAAGSEVPLHVGERPIPPKGGDKTSFEYLSALEELPRLEQQGDGMRSFTGVLLSVLISERMITLLDEPEAFLHPPQARLLGNMLANERTNDGQIFIATHSRDILHGLLDAGSDKVRVIRIEREGNVNHISELDNEGIRELWDDPILRYSNALNAMFHEHVVICEGDADCRFYQAIADVLYPDREDVKQPDALFIHGGGKDRISRLAKAMESLDIPLTIVTDFDVLNNEGCLSAIVGSVGGDWSELKPDWKIIKSHVDSKRPQLVTVDVRREIERTLGAVSDANFPEAAVEEIRGILKRSSPWQSVKESGKNGIPSGDAAKAFVSLDSKLRSLRIFVVPVGQLESFDKTTGNHGPKWVGDVLNKDLKNDIGLEEARVFVKAVFKDIAS